MANVIELRLRVQDDGTAVVEKFSRSAKGALEGVEDASKRTASGFAGIGNSGRDAVRGLGDVAAASTRGAAGLGALVASGGLVVGALGLVSAGFGASVRSAAAFQDQLNNVSTLVDTSVVDMRQLGQGLLEIDSALGPLEGNVKAAYQAISAGVEPAKAVKLVGSAAEFAAASLSDVFTSVDVGTTVMNTFGGSADRAYRVLQATVQLGKTTGAELGSSFGRVASAAVSLNATLEDTAGAIGFITTKGLATSEAVTGFAGILASLEKPSESAEKALTEMAAGTDLAGLSFADLRRQLADEGLIPTIRTLKEVTGGTSEALAQLIDSREARSALVAFMNDIDAANEFLEKHKKLSEDVNLVHAAAAKTTEDLASQWEGLKGDLERAFTAMGEGTQGPLIELVKGVRDATQAWRDYLKVRQGLAIAAPSITADEADLEAIPNLLTEINGKIATQERILERANEKLAALRAEASAPGLSGGQRGFFDELLGDHGPEYYEGQIDSARASLEELTRARDEALARQSDVGFDALMVTLGIDFPLATAAAGAGLTDLGNVAADTQQKLIELDISDAVDAGDVEAIRAGFQKLRDTMIPALDDGKRKGAELDAQVQILARTLDQKEAAAIERVSAALKQSAKDHDAVIKAQEKARQEAEKYATALKRLEDEAEARSAKEAALNYRSVERELKSLIDAQKKYGKEVDLSADIQGAYNELIRLAKLEYADLDEGLKAVGSSLEALATLDDLDLSVFSEEDRIRLKELIELLEDLDDKFGEDIPGAAEDTTAAVNETTNAWDRLISTLGGADFSALAAIAVKIFGKTRDGVAEVATTAEDASSSISGIASSADDVTTSVNKATDAVDGLASSAASSSYITLILELVLQVIPDDTMQGIDDLMSSIGSIVNLASSIDIPTIGLNKTMDELNKLTEPLNDAADHLSEEVDNWMNGLLGRKDSRSTEIATHVRTLLKDAFGATNVDEALREALAGNSAFAADGVFINSLIDSFNPKDISNAFRARIKEIDFPLDELSEATRRNLAHGERDVMITGAEAAAAFIAPDFGAGFAGEITRQLESVWGSVAASQGLIGADAEVFIDQGVAGSIEAMDRAGMSAEAMTQSVLDLGQSYGVFIGAGDLLATMNHELDQMGHAQGDVIHAMAGSVQDLTGANIRGAGSIQQAWEQSGLPAEEFVRIMREAIAETPGLEGLGPALDPLIDALITGQNEGLALQAVLDGFATTSTGIADAMEFLRTFSLGTNAEGDPFLRRDSFQNQIDAIDRQIAQAEDDGNRELVIRLTADRSGLEEQLAQAQSDLDLFNRALQEQLNDQLGVVRADDIITPEEAAGLVSIMQGALTEGGDALDESSRNLIRSIYSQLRFELGMTEDELLAMFSDTDLANIVEGVSFPVEEAADVNENLDGAGEGARTLAESLGLSSEDAAALNTALGSMAGTLTATSETAAGLAASFAGEGGVNPAVRELGATGVEQLGLFAAGITDGNTEAGYLDDTMLDLIGNQIDFGDEGERAMGRTEDGILDLYGPMDGYLERLREAFLLYDSLTGLTPPDPPDSPDTPDTKTRQVGRAPGREPGAYAYDFTPSLFSDANPPPSLITFGRVDASFPSAPSGLLATRDVAGATRSAGGSDDLSAAVREMREAAGQMRATASLLATTARAVADGADPRRIARDVATAIVDLDALEARPDGRIRERDLRP